ncbi:MAG: hypothetical protein JW745_05085 [Sedimentisphaerales bacterium]|nr:hypothetical protein [Sedimentisphaerales bacterium]MBN2842736.1 hypothetical protein [Sedimentisphaerales bacterium]
MSVNKLKTDSRADSHFKRRAFVMIYVLTILSLLFPAMLIMSATLSEQLQGLKKLQKLADNANRCPLLIVENAVDGQ